MNDEDGDDAVNDSQVEFLINFFRVISWNLIFLFAFFQDPSNSSAKSVDAASKNTVQSSHPFRVIDNDGLSIHSMQSLGRVGRILSGSLDPSAMSANRDSTQPQKDGQSSQQSESPTTAISESPSNPTLHASSGQRKSDDNQSQNSNYSLTMNPNTILQEPDVIASTKLAHSKTTDSVS
jgi:WD repeat-containing protein 44